VKDLASLLPIIGIFLIFWLLVIRPASRRQKKLAAVQKQLAIGDPVITGAGIFGTVVSVDDDKVGLEVASGVVLTVARQSVVGVVPDHDQPEPTDPTGTTETSAEPEAPRTHEEP
jgi:preprotein translocase subunit YajC